MTQLELTDAQLIDLVQQLSPERKRTVLFALARDAQTQRGERLAAAEERMRTLCAARGVNWNELTDEERLALINDLVHEDRSCAR